jgi:hypothetical protein
MVRTFSYLLAIASVVVVATATTVLAQKVTEVPGTVQPDRVRGQVITVEDTSMVIATTDGEEVRIALSDNLSVFSLSTAKFTDVDFGSYVGAVSVRLNTYSPIVRDSLSWLHHGFELRIIDEELRGIALGHTSWDLKPDSVMSHGWVDDLEIRVLSIKYGPTEEEEADVDIPRDVPILKMSLGDKSLIQPGAHVFAGAQKDANDNYAAVFVMVGEDGVVPSL